jgi:S-(hydroxymethyl)glutathione dehydrogenase/alcohol dehydrogenase
MAATESTARSTGEASTAIKTKAAVIRGTGQAYEILDLDLDPPKAHEVLIRYVSAGLCRSDEHLRTKDFWGPDGGRARFPMVGGHEGAGVVEEVGPGVTNVQVGDHVLCSFIPACGHCRFCSNGQQNLCDLGATIMEGCLVDGTFRFHGAGLDYGGLCMIGSFSQYGVVSEYSCVKIDKELPLDIAVIASCGVPTGWGSAVYTAKVEPGDTVVVYGIGGVGINAVQGARHAGAEYVVAVDPLEFKRSKAIELGATHAEESAGAAHETVQQLTRGVGADKAIITVSVVDKSVVSHAFDAVRKGGSITVVGQAPVGDLSVQIASNFLTNWEKRIQGSLFGSCNPFSDIPKLLRLYQSGALKLDELVTTKYSLDEVNKGYEDLDAGKNIRGIIVF